MPAITIPETAAPSNLRLRTGIKVRMVDGDLYDIALRLREMDPALYVVELAEGDRATWAIMEDCQDGVQRLVFKADVLDGRVLKRIERIMHVPFEQRFAEAEAQEAQAKQDQRDRELDDLYERVGAPMLTDLERCNFISRPISYAKRGVMGPRGR